MLTLLLIICLVLGGFGLQLRSSTALKICLGSFLLSVLLLGWLIYGPRDYMLDLPSGLCQIIFDPWTLGGLGFVTGLFAVVVTPLVILKSSWEQFQSARSSGEEPARSRRPLLLFFAAIVCVVLFYAFWCWVVSARRVNH